MSVKTKLSDLPLPEIQTYLRWWAPWRAAGWRWSVYERWQRAGQPGRPGVFRLTQGRGRSYTLRESRTKSDRMVPV